MKPRNVSVSAHDYQQECYVTVTFRIDRNRIQKEIEKVISNVDLTSVKSID